MILDPTIRCADPPAYRPDRLIPVHFTMAGFSVVAIGNPLLDITVPVKNELLSSYALQPHISHNFESDRAYLVEPENALRIIQDSGEEETRTLGGACLNMCRSLCALTEEAGSKVDVTYIGCVGNDPEGDDIEKRIASMMNAQLMRTTEAGTGICASLITERGRTFLAALGAAKHLSLEAIERPEVQAALDKADLACIYCFAVSDYADVALAFAQCCVDRGIPILLNLASPLMCTAFTDSVMKLVSLATIVFGNASEFHALASATGLVTSPAAESSSEISAEEGAYSDMDNSEYEPQSSEDDVPLDEIDAICNIPMNTLKGRAETLREFFGGRMVVVTNSSYPTIVMDKNHGLSSFIPDRVPRDEIRDTNGAGDCFVAGFVEGLGADLPELLAGCQRDFYDVLQGWVTVAHSAAARSLHHIGGGLNA